MDDPFRVLGVDAWADDAEVRQAYHQAVRRHPPERDPLGFSRVRQAFEALRDPERRVEGELAALLGEAESALEEGRPAAAAARCKRALVLRPDWAPGRAGLVRAWLGAGRFQEAIREADRLVRRHPEARSWWCLAARARRLWAERADSPPGRVRRLVREATALLERAGVSEEAGLERARLWLLQGQPERALEALLPCSGEAQVLAAQIHLERRDRRAFQAVVDAMGFDEDAGIRLASLAREAAEQGRFGGLGWLVAAAERVAPASDAVESLLQMPSELLRLLRERGRIPAGLETLRRLVGLEIDYMRLPEGRDAPILEHWEETLAELLLEPAARRRAWVARLRRACPTLCERNPATLAVLEEE